MSSVTASNSTCIGRKCFRKDEPKISSVRKLHIKCSVASSTPQSMQFAKVKTQTPEKTVQIAVLGASGYTGSEIVRLLTNHPYFGITLMTADRKASQSIGSVFSHLVSQV